MKVIEVHTCPLWEHPSGHREPGMAFNPHPPPTVGWVNVMLLDIGGEKRRLLLTLDAG